MELADRILSIIEQGGGKEVCEDLVKVISELKKSDYPESHRYNLLLREIVSERAKEEPLEYFPIYKDLLLIDATERLDEYMLYLEINRPIEARFYQNRRKQLKVVVDAMQDLIDNKLDELIVSLPPRVGKTTLYQFLISFIIGKKPDRSNLYSSYTDIITGSFYNGILEIITDPDTYTWQEVFPMSRLIQTNSKDETLNINRKRKYNSLTCRSLYGTLNGACDCNYFLVGDDLLSGIEEALSPERLNGVWTRVDNNLLSRKVGGNYKINLIGTRWSLADPIGRRLDLLQNSKEYKNIRWKAICIPALDENDESNFDYPYELGFTTEEYHRIRASFENNNDMASWFAQYMGEPVERQGTLFTPDKMNFYNGDLPEGDPRVYITLDPAFGGGDYCAAPIGLDYGDNVYIPDVIYSNEDKKVTIPLICEKIAKYHPHKVVVEATRSLQSYVEQLVDYLKQHYDLKIPIISKPADTKIAKDQRIFDAAPDIIDRFVFLEDRPKHYELFMQNVYSFKVFGKNKHDDAPDSLSMLSRELGITEQKKVFKAFTRPF